MADPLDPPLAEVPVDIESIELEVQLHQLVLNGAPLSLGTTETGAKVLVVGPLLLQLQIPLGPDVARTLGSELLGGIELPRGSMAIPRTRRRG